MTRTKKPNKNLKTLSARVKPELYQRMLGITKKRSVTMSDLLNEIVNNWFDLLDFNFHIYNPGSPSLSDLFAGNMGSSKPNSNLELQGDPWGTKDQNSSPKHK